MRFGVVMEVLGLWSCEMQQSVGLQMTVNILEKPIASIFSYTEDAGGRFLHLLIYF
jgi:hypothetical protein